MAKELLIGQTLNECRAVLIENGEILDFLLERLPPKKVDVPIVGNIYKGRVLRVLPGMQSAFVDIGYEKAAFLYVDDAYIPTLEEQREMAEKAKKINEEDELSRLGKVIPDEFSTLSDVVNMKLRPLTATIETFLKEGDEIIVQVAKEPISTKGPRVTRHITLAGRHVVFMPFIEHTGVSRRIESEAERDRLKEILETIRPEGTGIIARTVAEAQSYKVLKLDFNLLVKIWKDLEVKAVKSKAPSNLHQDMSFVQRVLRDITDEDVSSIVADDKENYNEIEKFVARYLPNMKGKVVYYNEDTPLYEKYNLEMEIERGLSNRVFLRSGGSLNIEQTEALVSIDVNTGKFVGRKTLEETILMTNLEAVKEISYQLRLRNCGGIIIIDFIDMERHSNRQKVYYAIKNALKKDKVRTTITKISDLGLVEMTRKRTRDSLTQMISETCFLCQGKGHIKSPETVTFELFRELNRTVRHLTGRQLQVSVHPRVAQVLFNEARGRLDGMEKIWNKRISVNPVESFAVEKFEITTKN